MEHWRTNNVYYNYILFIYDYTRKNNRKKMIIKLIGIITSIAIILFGFLIVIYCYIKDTKKYKLRNGK